MSLDRPVAETRRLAAGQRELLTWPLVADNEAGFGKVAVEVPGPGNFAVRREWDIQVRAAQTPSAVDTVSQLAAGRELTLDRNVTASFAPGTAQVGVSLTRIPGIDVAALLRALDKYPVRLHRADDEPRPAVALLQRRGAAGLRPGRSVHRRPRAGCRLPHRRHAVARRLVRHVGALSPAAEWLQGYALDFLLRARDQQMAVPAASLQRGLTWLNRTADKFTPNAQAYGWYVLAKAGLADPGRIRYFQDNDGGKITTALPGAARRGTEPCGRARPGAARLRQGARAAIDVRSRRLLRLGRCAPAPRCWRWRRKPPAATASPRSRAGGRAADREGRVHDHAGAGRLVMAARAMAGRRRARLLGRRRAARRRRASPSSINPDPAAIAARPTGEERRRAARSGCRSPRAACRTTRSPRRLQGLAFERDYLTLDGKRPTCASCARTTG